MKDTDDEYEVIHVIHNSYSYIFSEGIFKKICSTCAMVDASSFPIWLICVRINQNINGYIFQISIVISIFLY